MTGEKLGKTCAWAWVLCAAAALSACHKDDSAAPATAPQVKPKAAVAQKLGPTAAEQTVGMVEAAAQGKSVAPVALKFELPQRPKVGQPMDINLAVISQVDASATTLQISGGDGITVSGGAAQFDIAATQAGDVVRQTVNVTPTDEGVLLVGVSVSFKHDEITDTKAFAIPIIADK